MDKILENSKPYNMFVTKIQDAEVEHAKNLQSITFEDIFDKSLGEIQETLQINFVVDFKWLMNKYKNVDLADKPLLILHGRDLNDLDAFELMEYSNITTVRVKTPEYGTHHSKIMIIEYKDKSIRIVISTANLYQSDWGNRTQGIWISPKCPALSSPEQKSQSHDSKTYFKKNLVKYLNAYNILELQFWINRIQNCDFSEINVFFIGSVPGFHRADDPSRLDWGHPGLGNILQKHCDNAEMDSSIVVQCSMIGFLGPTINSWVAGEFCDSLYQSVVQNIDDPDFKLIYPTMKNIEESIDGVNGADCFPYSEEANNTQPWLSEYLYQWKSTKNNLDKAAPHIKSYARLRENLSWFCLTSANLSKAAWGSYFTDKKGKRYLRMKNYEAGVLYLPKFVLNESYFEIDEFPLPYDVPLKKYEADDKPFIN